VYRYQHQLTLTDWSRNSFNFTTLSDAPGINVHLGGIYQLIQLTTDLPTYTAHHGFTNLYSSPRIYQLIQLTTDLPTYAAHHGFSNLYSSPRICQLIQLTTDLPFSRNFGRH
jgi:hypothetical protein